MLPSFDFFSASLHPQNGVNFYPHDIEVEQDPAPHHTHILLRTQNNPNESIKQQHCVARTNVAIKPGTVAAMAVQDDAGIGPPPH